MRIGVSGASGQLGASTVAELVRRGGHDIVGISRSPERVPAPVGQRGPCIAAEIDCWRFVVLTPCTRRSR
jgi:NAD(P)H dehydrogenase (quinone)